MTILQLSVFIENRKGRLEEVLEILGGSEINIVALSLADTQEYGVLRMIVSDPERGQEILKQHGISSKTVNVIAIRVPHAVGSLSRAMQILADAGLNVEYMYAFANGEDASAVLKITEPEKAAQVLVYNGFSVWQAKDAYTANIND